VASLSKRLIGKIAPNPVPSYFRPLMDEFRFTYSASEEYYFVSKEAHPGPILGERKVFT